jgi:hypothetical protein
MSLFKLPVTATDLEQLQQGIQFFTNAAEATAEAAQINNGADTVYNYAVRLLSANISLSQVTMAVDSLMFSQTENVTELAKLTTQFLPPQIVVAINNGFNPTVFAAEALGLGLANGNGTSNNFAQNFGSLSVQQFANAVANITGTHADAIVQFVNNWIAFYTANPAAIPGLSITLASYGAAFGDSVGVALLNPPPISPINQPAVLPDARFNVVQNDVYNALKDNAEGSYVAGVDISALPPETLLQGEVVAPFTPGQFFTLTISQDTFVGRPAGGVVFNAPLSGPFGGQPTLTNGDSLTATGPNNVLNATFAGDHSAHSLNITGVQTWNIDQTGGSGSSFSTVTLTGDAATGNVISALTTLNVNFDETSGCVIIGDNSSPVQETSGAFASAATAFTITVLEAVGSGFFSSEPTVGVSDGVQFNSPCVDVDFAAATFTGKDFINVTANIVGGFPLSDTSSFIIPPEILGPDNGDLDDYDPAWLNYLADSFSISAGASSGNQNPALGPIGGAVGFAFWNVASIGAQSVGTLNIIALGGEGSQSAQTITLTDDGSNTMLFATAASDSLSTDWKNVTKIDMSTGSTGFVTITGLETDVQEVGIGLPEPTFTVGVGLGFIPPVNNLTPSNFASEFQEYDGGGLLASDTSALVTILGGNGNSFYDLSSLTPAAATNTAALFDGGHSTAGNSEISFNNQVFTSGSPVNISHVQILDDVSSISSFDGGTGVLENGGEAQGGIINMANFLGTANGATGLQPLNVAYALLAEDLQPNGGVGALPPPGLPFTAPQFLFTPPEVGLPPNQVTQASLLPPTVSPAVALDLQNGVVPAGFDLLQLLNAEGSTQTTLGAKLIIENGPSDFAINMQDTGDGTVVRSFDSSEEQGNVTSGTWSGFDITITEQTGAPPTTVNTADTLILFVSDDGAYLTYAGKNGGSPSDVGGFTQPPSHEGRDFYGTAMFVPQFTVDNYSTVDIVLPTESFGVPELFGSQGGFENTTDVTQNYVILGGQDPIKNGPGFIDTPVVTVQNPTVNFFDNHADNGGSPLGGVDDLVLGFTNFTAPIGDPFSDIAYIGVPSVVIDVNPLDFSTTINDFGAGSLEIGATNVTNLNAQSTSHLIMDLPAALDGNHAGGITVNGSLVGQNLIQGTSGIVDVDNNGHNPSNIFAVLVPDAPLTVIGADDATVLQSHNQSSGIGWGNDVLTGGDGFGSVRTSLVGGAVSQTFTVGVFNTGNGHFPTNETDGTPGPDLPPGSFWHLEQSFGTGSNAQADPIQGPANSGDNFFPLGGNDIVNISTGEVGTLTALQEIVSGSGTVLASGGDAFANYSTVWVGVYDVCNSAGPDASVLDPGAPNSGVGTIYDQAITSLNSEGESVFVDGYGATGQDENDPNHPTDSPAVTINNFHFAGGTADPETQGDTIVFAVQSWATSDINDGKIDVPGTSNDFPGTILGLVDSTGHQSVSPSHNADFANVGTAGEPVGGSIGDRADVITYEIGTALTGAQNLQSNLGDSQGNFLLNSGGLAPGTEVDILVAYARITGPGTTDITIADVTLTNTEGGFEANTENLNPVVHDLVHIANPLGVGVGALFDHNVFFVA